MAVRKRLRTRVVRGARIAVLIASPALLVGCQLLGGGSGGPALSAKETTAGVAAVAGWTRLASTASFLIVANVLPGEEMFTQKDFDRLHPAEGELILQRTGRKIGPDVRHVEAHVYDRTTGLPRADVTLTIVVVNRTTGERTMVPPTLMQDVNIGASDVHYGNNVMIRGNSDLSLKVTVGHEEVTLDGHID